MNVEQTAELKEQLTEAQEIVTNLESDRPRIESDFLQANQALETARLAHRGKPDLDSVTAAMQKQQAARSILEMIDGEIILARGVVNGLSDKIGQIESLEQLKKTALESLKAGKDAHARFDASIKAIWDAIYAARALEKDLVQERGAPNAVGMDALERLGALQGLERGLPTQMTVAAQLGSSWEWLVLPTWPAGTQLTPLKG
jgi:DNA repair exonuclease SbcCD ATPase subunit